MQTMVFEGSLSFAEEGDLEAALISVQEGDYPASVLGEGAWTRKDLTLSVKVEVKGAAATKAARQDSLGLIHEMAEVADKGSVDCVHNVPGNQPVRRTIEAMGEMDMGDDPLGGLDIGALLRMAAKAGDLDAPKPKKPTDQIMSDLESARGFMAQLGDSIELLEPLSDASLAKISAILDKAEKRMGRLKDLTKELVDLLLDLDEVDDLYASDDDIRDLLKRW